MRKWAIVWRSLSSSIISSNDDETIWVTNRRETRLIQREIWLWSASFQSVCYKNTQLFSKVLGLFHISINFRSDKSVSRHSKIWLRKEKKECLLYHRRYHKVFFSLFNSSDFDYPKKAWGHTKLLAFAEGRSCLLRNACFWCLSTSDVLNQILIFPLASR